MRCKNKIITILILSSFLLQIIPFLTIDVSASGIIINDSGYTYGTSYNMERKIARTNNTWLHVAYKKIVGGIQNVYYAQSQNSGSTWSNTAITSYAINNGDFSPGILVDHHNHIWITWTTEKTSGTAYYNISYVKSTDNGSTWSAISNVYSSSTYPSNNGTFAANNMGDIMFVWSGRYSGSGLILQPRYCRYNGTSHTFGAVGNLSLSGFNCYTPTICSDYDNNFHLVFERTVAPYDKNMNYYKYTNTTKTWGSLVTIGVDTTEQLRPSIAVNSTNGIHLVYYGIPDGDTSRRIRYANSPTGATWSIPINLTSGVMNNAYTPTISIDETNKIHVAYHAATSPTRSIYYTSSTDNGATWSIPTGIITDATEDRYPSMLWSSSPHYLTNYTDRPKTGYALIWTADNDVKYYSSIDLTWDTLTPPPPPPDYKPGIAFGSGTTTNGTTLVNDWININLSSTDGSYSSYYMYAGAGQTSGPDVYRYDNTSWTTNYDGTTPADAGFIDITEYNDKLYGAVFGNNPGDGAIYTSDGSAWNISYNGTTENGYYSLCEYNGLLYAGGMGYVKVFDGITWTTSTSSSLYYTSMHTFGGNLYVGTYNAGSVDDANIWKYDGAAWTKVYDGGSFSTQYDWCYALEEYNGALWAGMGSLATNSADVFNTTDGTTWTISLNATTGNSIWDLKTFNGSLFASQGFTAAEGDIWRFNGTAWLKTWDLATYSRLFALGVYAGKIWTATYPYSRIFSSPDGTTWTLDSTFSNGELQCFYTTNVSHHYTILDFDRDLLQWSRMDHYTGTKLIDNSTWNNNGTITGNALQYSNGVYGDCFSFDGDGDYISIPTSSSLNTIDATTTVSLWAKSDQDYGYFPQNGRGLFGFYLDSSHRLWIGITKSNPGTCSNTVSMYDRLGPAYHYESLSPALPVDFIKQWHQYTFVFTSSNVTCYIDGVYTGEASFDTTYLNLDSLPDGFTTSIGRGSWSASTWDWYGDIDEFLLFNRAFNITEVMALNDATTTQYRYNFTGLSLGNYTFQGSAVNTLGYMNQTVLRWSNLNVQYPPTVISTTPINGSTNGDLFQTCEVTIYDPNNDTVNITWQTNESGAWITKHYDTNVPSGDSSSYKFMVFSELATTYYWRVWLNDSVFNISYIYHFRIPGSFFSIEGLTDGVVDWYGLTGASYWCNATGPHTETMRVIMSVGPSDEVLKAGVWVGDLSIVHTDTLSIGLNTNVEIPIWAIAACPSDSVGDVFDSIYDHLVNITEVGTGKWWNRTGTPTLLHILPTSLYNILVNQSCQIYIVSGVRVNASNISVQFSSNNITWGSNTRSFEDGGSEIFVNNTLWTNPNGCYGANPWGSPIINVTAYMYLRFKLNLPINLPSNYTYFSLSSTNWKMNFYSSNTSTEVLPPLKLPSTLPTGDFLLKWQNISTNIWGLSEPVSKDINGDGRQEIFFSGYDTSYSPLGQKRRTSCFNGTTGALMWTKRSGSGYLDVHAPIVVYDFDKDGEYELILASEARTIMLNAMTGIEEWNVSVQSGWHHFGYIDTGPVVYVYVSGHDEIPPYDAKISKIYGENGTIVAQASMYFSCYGGTSIADINNDGKYEVVISDRGQDKYPGTAAKSVRCYDEDLNLLWYATYPSCSSHSPMLIDVNGDGDLEVIIGRQSGANSGVYIFNPDGTILRSQASIAGVYFHTQPCIYDVDYDGVYEIMDGFGTASNIISLDTLAIEYTLPYSSSEPPDVGNVILDPGPDDTRSEIIVCRSPNPMIFKYNTTTHLYDLLYTFTGVRAQTAIVQDFDHDGYNELFFSYNHSMYMYETKVTANLPRTRTETAYDGERRLNNGEYYPGPYYGEGLIESLSFGGEASIPAITSGTFISSCISQHSIIEYNGFYNLGNYTTYLNTSIYLPNLWSLDTVYYRIKNTNGTVYENITTGFSISTINTTHKRITKLYNPSTSMTGVKLCNVDVYVRLMFSGITQFEGNETFNGVFTIYHIDPPYNGSSSYNTTTNALNMTWDPGNYTDRYIVVRKSGINYPVSPTDGTVVQNNTLTTYNESSVTTSRAYSVFGYNRSSRSYSDPLNNPWGAMGINCYNESNPSQNLTFNLFITNEAGTQTYVATGCTNTQYLDFADIPTGTRTVVQVTSTGYKVRYYYMDLLPNMLHSLNAYLPPDKITGGGGGTSEPTCVQRLYIDSKTITSYTTDQTVNLTFALDTLVDVQLFNRSLYGTYGGWYFIPADKYTTSTTQVIVNKTVLDKNSTILKVTYYYEDCTTVEGEPGLYLITVWDYYDQPIQDVKVEFKVYINTTDQYEPVSILYTDSMGQVNLYLIPFSIYKVVCSKDLFITSISDYIPDPNIRVHTFKLNAEEPSGVAYEDIYHNLSWTLEPKNRYQSGSFMVWFNITSLDDQLEWYRMKIDRYNSSSLLWINIYNGNTTDQAGGGTLSFLMPNTTGRCRVQTYFKKIGFPIYEIGYSEGGCDIFHISGGGCLADNAMIKAIPGWVYMAIVLIIAAFVMAFALPMAGIGTGFIGIGIIGFAMVLKPDLIMDDGTTGWVILTITTLVYSLGVFVWSRI